LVVSRVAEEKRVRFLYYFLYQTWGRGCMSDSIFVRTENPKEAIEEIIAYFKEEHSFGEYRGKAGDGFVVLEDKDGNIQVVISEFTPKIIRISLSVPFADVLEDLIDTFGFENIRW